MIINLTAIELDWSEDVPSREKVVHVNKYQIKYFSPMSWKNHNNDTFTFTEVQIGDRVSLLVKESPEVILSLIKES